MKAEVADGVVMTASKNINKIPFMNFILSIKEQRDFKRHGQSHDGEKITQGLWKMGVLKKKNDMIYWEDLCDKESALDAAVKHYMRRHSFVIFDPSGVPVLFSGFHSAFDVGLILHSAQRSETSPKHPNNIDSTNLHASSQMESNRRIAEELVCNGDLPFVPIPKPIWLQWLMKRTVEMVFNRETVRYFACGPLRYSKSLYFFDVRKYPSVRGHVALTLDDAPCRFTNKANSRLQEVLALLDDYNAKATFMVVGKFMSGEHDSDIVDLFNRGHELGNHGKLDFSLNTLNEEDFLRNVDECNKKIVSLQKRATKVPQEQTVRWFRAPHGKYTRKMEKCLSTRGLRNVMCDTYASCPIVEDGQWIGDSLARNAQDGSIILLHMPERGFRDWCIVALHRLLEGLRQKGFQTVTISELDRIAKNSCGENIRKYID